MHCRETENGMSLHTRRLDYNYIVPQSKSGRRAVELGNGCSKLAHRYLTTTVQMDLPLMQPQN